MSASVALSPYSEAFIRQQIESGRYNNTGDVICVGLMALIEREQQMKLDALQKAVNEGINSGESKNAEEVFGRLSQKYRRQVEGGKA
ncbi:type II toxin-antitoxin system ParD family antitoxin [Pantoea agglomerans]|uniref:type II toxin-antitoxin system ParD family antitoxin n=1 Tax=Enterobacter agglomerans TaxID=549 RepID=UPI003DA1B252